MTYTFVVQLGEDNYNENARKARNVRAFVLKTPLQLLLNNQPEGSDCFGLEPNPNLTRIEPEPEKPDPISTFDRPGVINCNVVCIVEDIQILKPLHKCTLYHVHPRSAPNAQDFREGQEISETHVV